MATAKTRLGMKSKGSSRLGNGSTTPKQEEQTRRTLKLKKSRCMVEISSGDLDRPCGKQAVAERDVAGGLVPFCQEHVEEIDAERSRPFTVDATADDLRNAVYALPSVQPLTDRFRKRWRGLRGAAQERDGVYYNDTNWLPNCCPQQRHWCAYITAKLDAPDDEDNPHPTARQCYQRVHNPQLLLYLAEGAEVDPGLIELAAKHALAAATSMPSMAKAFRAVIPWDMMSAALAARQNLGLRNRVRPPTLPNKGSVRRKPGAKEAAFLKQNPQCQCPESSDDIDDLCCKPSAGWRAVEGMMVALCEEHLAQLDEEDGPGGGEKGESDDE